MLGALPSMRVAAAIYAVAIVAYASLPLLAGDVERPWLAVLIGAGLLALSGFGFVFGVDLTLDPRIQKQRTRGMIHRTLLTSGASALLATALVGAAAWAGGGRPAVMGLLAAVVWGQWMVEALGVRDLYGVTYAAAFGLVALMRTLSTVLGGLVGLMLLPRIVHWGLGT